MELILGFDLTSSMKNTSLLVARNIEPTIMDFTSRPNVKSTIVSLGDFEYDDMPYKVDSLTRGDLVNIVEQNARAMNCTGGSNDYESYSAAWYYGLHKSTEKGIIITFGDECINPWITPEDMLRVIGDKIHPRADSTIVYREAAKRYQIYHISVDSPDSAYMYRKEKVDKTWCKIVPKEHYFTCTLANVDETVQHILNTYSE